MTNNPNKIITLGYLKKICNTILINNNIDVYKEHSL